MTYNITFFRYNTAEAKHRYYSFLNNHFTQILNDEEERASMDEETTDDFWNKQKFYSEQATKALETVNSEFELFKAHKTEVIEILHQIHFYYGDHELGTLINDFQNIFIS